MTFSKADGERGFGTISIGPSSVQIVSRLSLEAVTTTGTAASSGSRICTLRSRR
jgi:hypothetical protein